ncbi:hypothetical protein ACFVT8_23660 [Lysinibacillus sp. NPDC058147]|uniref:hypothetical protein n=1 Tax=unclassified Lysinibacillus TaxID=2636778 RepID=UPI0036DD5D82
MRKLKVILTLFFLVILSACSSENSSESSDKSIEPIINATQFSKINSAQLVEIMGKPEKVENYEWLVPKTKQSIVGKLYIYEKNKFEFLLFDDVVTRLNVYSGQYWGYDDSTMNFEKKDDIFPLFGIEPNKQLKKVADTNYALRYSPVSDKIDDVWIQEIEDKNFGIAKFTYDSNYF